MLQALVSARQQKRLHSYCLGFVYSELSMFSQTLNPQYRSNYIHHGELRIHA